ncbi:MAG: ABC transporter permease [Marinilabiliales bacterium]
MKETLNISYENVILGYAILAIPIFIFLYYKTQMLKDLIISVLRMTLQLAFVALYLEYIFKWNNAYINSAWVIVMIVASAWSSVKHSELKRKHLIVPMLIAGFFSILITDAYFLGIVIKLDYVFEARYFIPISGMILGNMLKYNAVGLNTYFSSIQKDQNLYFFLLVHNNQKLALLPFIREAFKKAMNPYIGTIAIIGLVSLPGMMTGQILGGSSPVVAIKYQIMIVISIFVACVLNLFLSLQIANMFVFDIKGRLKSDVLAKK